MTSPLTGSQSSDQDLLVGDPQGTVRVMVEREMSAVVGPHKDDIREMKELLRELRSMKSNEDRHYK